MISRYYIQMDMYNKKLAIHQLLLYSTHFSQSGMQIERRETEPHHLLCLFLGTCKGARISSSSLSKEYGAQVTIINIQSTS